VSEEGLAHFGLVWGQIVRKDVVPGNQVDNKLRYLRYPSFTIYYMWGYARLNR